MGPMSGFVAVAAPDDMASTKPVVDFATANAGMYVGSGYMIDAFNKGAIRKGEPAKILAAVTDDLWAPATPMTRSPGSMAATRCGSLPRSGRARRRSVSMRSIRIAFA